MGSSIGGAVGVNPVALIEARYGPGVSGGTLTALAWQTRPLNTVVADEAGIVSLASNQITLQAGKYRVSAFATAMGVDGVASRFYNVTDAVIVGYGTSDIAANTYSGSKQSSVNCEFEITAAKVFELQSFSETTRANSGMGYRILTTANNVYASIKIEKVG